MPHWVICTVCHQRFDRDKVPAVRSGARRYAHTTCASSLSQQELQQEQDKQELYDYLKKLFGTTAVNARISLQLKKYKEQYPDYSYSGIRRTLEYFYEIKKNPIEKANGGIGIVPYVYEEAKRYYHKQWLLSQKNIDKNIQQYVLDTQSITIPPPERKRRKKRIFTFLDEEGEE